MSDADDFIDVLASFTVDGGAGTNTLTNNPNNTSRSSPCQCTEFKA